MAKNYEELKLSDDFMFGKVMEDGELCREVLECLLEKPLDELTGKLHRAVEAGRRNEKWRSEYMKELLHDDDMREEGRAEERANTEREKANAEREKARADALEARVHELEGIISNMPGENRKL